MADPNPPNNPPNIRLSKLMSERGLCSRREADELIAAGLVKVNGSVIDQLGTRVDPDCEIEVLPRAQKILSDKVSIMINKPIGYVSSQPEGSYRAAVELVTAENQYFPPNISSNISSSSSESLRFHPKHLRGLAPAGRLDIDSQGLLILTQDGVMAKRIIGENSGVEKEYLVRVNGVLSKENLNRLRDGSMVIEGRQLKPAHVEWLNEDQLRFVLTEGMKRQIRKMCEGVGLKVMGLKRVRIGKLNLGNLPEGRWRFVSPSEL